MDRRIPEQLLAPLVRSGTRLLHVEANGSRELSLRFDRGAVLVLLVDGGLELGGGRPPSESAEALDESDPWWTVIGQPLSGAWSVVDTDQRRLVVELQLRLDGESPKIVTLEPRGPRIRARAVAKSAWAGAN
ncbi:MAG: hypothetical protein WEF50_16215 [Myxococcota bacterium]